MRPSSQLEKWLKTFHWEDLANLQTDLCFVRHQLIHTTNTKLANPAVGTVENLGKLAQVDEQIQRAGMMLEMAKRALFDYCREQSSRPNNQQTRGSR